MVANCCIHALQLQLSNGIKQALGEGALENINVMQMLHSVYRLQEILDIKEWRHILCRSSEFVCDFDPATVQEGPAAAPETAPAVADVATEEQPSNKKKKTKKKKTKAQIAADNKATFELDYKKVHQFHTAFRRAQVDPEVTKCEGTVLCKMSQPILTRWWTVGSGASYTFDCCLVLFHAAQTVINIYPSGSTPNDIASDLFAMMKDQHNFIDMCLIRTFNKAYINPHLDWFQSSDDLTSALGFQSHQVAVRCHLMDYDLRSMLTSGRTANDYHIAVNRGNPEDEALHLKKLQAFGTAARASLYKHFDRWLKSSLLPAALMAEEPCARVVAAVMLKTTPTHGIPEDRMTGFIPYESTAHKRKLDMKKFCAFLKTRIESIGNDDEHVPEAQQAAQIVSGGGDMRTFDYEGDDGVVRHDMHSTYLPLACQTQFVESIVKEAKLVAQTDRSEQHRSWLAIIRSVTPLGKAEKNANAEKIKAIINSARARASEHMEMTRSQVNKEHDSWFAACSYALSKRGHFEQDRIDAKKTRVESQGVVFKCQNVAQQTKQQHLIPAITGMIPYGKLVQS